jgi:hypothetical protein
VVQGLWFVNAVLRFLGACSFDWPQTWLGFQECNTNLGHRCLCNSLSEILGRLVYALSIAPVVIWWSQWGVMRQLVMAIRNGADGLTLCDGYFHDAMTPLILSFYLWSRWVFSAIS